MTLHYSAGVQSSWPNGVGKGLFVQTVTCSCGLTFEASDTNDYYDLSVAAAAEDRWHEHALPVNRAVIDAELSMLPEAFGATRCLLENELKRWTHEPPYALNFA